MTEKVQIGFEAQAINVGLEKLLPTRSVQPEVRKTRKFAQILSSIREIGLIEPLIVDGHAVSDTGRDLMKLFVIERHTGSGSIGKGFITGFGMTRGALGCTISHDSHHMIIAGVDDASIFKAARHLNKLRGGLVFAVGDEVLLDLPLPIAGLMSDRDARFVVERLHEFEELFRREGFANPSPLMTLSFMALPVIPSLKITDRGLIDVDRFVPVELFTD